MHIIHGSIKIHAGKKIHIIGDYDIDGICSTTILYKGLKAAGADVTFAVPDRIIDGYGINEHLIDDAYNNGTDTIITCDNGIAAIEQIKYAKEKGMTVIVTDHHDIPFDFVDGEKIHKVPQAYSSVISFLSTLSVRSSKALFLASSISVARSSSMALLAESSLPVALRHGPITNPM